MKSTDRKLFTLTAYICYCKDLNTRLLLGRQCLWDYDAVLHVKNETLDILHPDSESRVEIPGIQFNTQESVLAMEPPEIPVEDKT